MTYFASVIDAGTIAEQQVTFVTQLIIGLGPQQHLHIVTTCVCKLLDKCTKELTFRTGGTNKNIIIHLEHG